MDSALAAIFAAHDLTVDPPDAVLAEARRVVQQVRPDDPALTDLTALPFCTIDEVDSRDLDQALFIEGAGDQGFVVWYALADASAFVTPGAALWDDALQRGASYYLPGLVAPMLPRLLSEDRCSLSPDVDRRALVFRVVLDAGGRVQDTRLLQARVHSRAKLSYDGVQAWYDGGAAPCHDPAVLASLQRLVDVGRLRLALAEERDVVRFRRTEIKVEVASEGDDLVFVAHRDLRLPVERYNEQISVLCNVEGARLLRASRAPDLIQPIYRVHAPPQPERLAALRDQLDAIVAAQGLDAGWRWRQGQESLSSYLERLPAGRVAQAIHRQAMMSAGRASFTARAGEHHGLGADVYARFTAPMREIVGVFLHSEAKELLAGRPGAVPAGVPDDDVLRASVIDVSNRAHQVQKALDRDANRRVLDHLLAADLDGGGERWRRGTVMGLTRRKVHVLLDDPAVDVKLYLHHLEAAAGVRLRVSADGASLEPTRGKGLRLAVGDAVDVCVRGVDPRTDRWRLDCRRA